MSIAFGKEKSPLISVIWNKYSSVVWTIILDSRLSIWKCRVGNLDQLAFRVRSKHSLRRGSLLVKNWIARREVTSYHEPPWEEERTLRSSWLTSLTQSWRKIMLSGRNWEKARKIRWVFDLCECFGSVVHSLARMYLHLLGHVLWTFAIKIGEFINKKEIIICSS